MADDQISPELVLVDPELGEQARADLPWAAADVPWSEARPPAPTGAAAPARLERPRTGFTIAATLWLFGAVAVAVTLVVELLPERGPRPTLAPALARKPPPASKPAPAASPAAPASKPKPRARKAKPAPAAKPAVPRPQPPPAQRPKPKPKAQSTQPQPRRPPPAASKPKPKPKPQQKTQRRPPAAAAPPAKRRAPPPAFQPARVFAWAPHPGASYYHVVIRRDGRLFYEGWPREARLEIPGRFRFRPGEYTWRVEPGTGERSAKQLGPAIVESSFTIKG